MRMTEIIDELPRLSASARPSLSRKLVETEAEHQDMESGTARVREDFAMLRQMEAEDKADGRRA